MKKSINQVQVKPYLVKNEDPTKNAGYQLFPELYANIFICAKKNSGKTCTVGKILEESAYIYGQDRYGFFGPTTVFIISSTVDKDPTYESIQKILEDKGIPVITATSITSLPEFLETASDAINQAKLELNTKEEEEDPPNFLNTILGIPSEPIQKKTKKIKIKKSLIKFAPRFIFVFDDLSEEIKSPILSSFVKKNRHYLSKVIISSQFPLDLKPDARNQIDYWLLFTGHDDDKLEMIFKNADLHITFRKYLQFYRDATQPHNFLYIDAKKSKFRHNFNLEYNA